MKQTLARFGLMLPGMQPRPPSSCRVPDAGAVSVSREKSIQSFPANARDPIKASEAQAGHCSAQFPTQWQSSQRYALAKGMYCIERSVIYQPRLSRIGTILVVNVGHL
jgi:hypothetical protein